MNYINLLELIKGSINYDIFKTLKDSFAEDYQTEYKSLRDLCELSGTDARALFISQGSGAAAIILPVRGKVVKIGENINTQAVFKYTGSIEDALFDESLKSMREGA